MLSVARKKIISILLIVNIVAPSLITLAYPAHEAQAQISDGSGWAIFSLKVKSNVDDSIQATNSIWTRANDVLARVAMGVAKGLLRKMTLSTIDWINGGFKGNPAFIQHPESFFQDFANQELDRIVGIVAYDSINYPFGRSFAQNLILSLQNKFEQNARFTLQSVLGQRHWTDFVDRCFSCGGWNGYLSLSQPMNNPYGFSLRAHEEYYRVTAGLDESKINETKRLLEEAGGLLSPEICVEPASTNQKWASPEEEQRAHTELALLNKELSDLELEKLTYQNLGLTDDVRQTEEEIAAKKIAIDGHKALIADHTCDRYEYTTPGVAITAGLENLIGSNFRQTELGAALGADLSAIFDAAFNQLLTMGLDSLSKPSQGSAQTTETRNLDYYGLSVGTGENTGDWRNTPDVVVNLKELLLTGEPGPLLDPNDDPATGVRGPNGPTVIALVEQEIAAYKSILNTLELMPKKLMELDACLPGPDYGWEGRFQSKYTKEIQRLERKSTKSNEKKAEEYEKGINQAERIRSETLWNIKNAFFSFNIPSAITIDDKIKQTSDRSTSAKIYQDTIVAKTATLNRLRVLASEYGVAETVTEKSDIAKRYLDMSGQISSESSLREARAQLAELQGDYEELTVLKAVCETEKEELGYNDAGALNIAASDTSSFPEPFKDIDLAEASNIFDDITAIAVINQLEADSIEVSPSEEIEIVDLNARQLVILYALIDQKNLTLQESLSEMDNIPEALVLPASIDAEIAYYCQGVNFKAYDTGAFKSFGNAVLTVATGPVGMLAYLFGGGDVTIDIDCEDFYRSDIWDYKIEKDTPTTP